jgi:hypothetical protein
MVAAMLEEAPSVHRSDRVVSPASPRKGASRVPSSGSANAPKERFNERLSAPSKLRIFLSGGAGFIESHVADHIFAHGHEVAVVNGLSTAKREPPRGRPVLRARHAQRMHRSLRGVRVLGALPAGGSDGRQAFRSRPPG